MRLRLLPLTIILCYQGHAAFISISSIDATDTAYDLTNIYGTADWAFWNTIDNPASSGAPLNSMAGANLITDISTVGGGDIRGSSSLNTPIYDFSFTNGNPTASGTEFNPIGLQNTQLNTIGAGVQLDIASPTSDPFEIYVWGTAFAATGQLTATIGGTSDSDSSLVQGAFRDPGRFYTVSVTPDSAGQIVNLQMVLANSTSSSGNVSLSAVSLVPEPSTYALSFGIAVITFGVWRKRRRS